MANKRKGATARLERQQRVIDRMERRVRSLTHQMSVVSQQMKFHDFPLTTIYELDLKRMEGERAGLRNEINRLVNL